MIGIMCKQGYLVYLPAAYLGLCSPHEVITSRIHPPANTYAFTRFYTFDDPHVKLNWVYHVTAGCTAEFLKRLEPRQKLEEILWCMKLWNDPSLTCKSMVSDFRPAHTFSSSAVMWSWWWLTGKFPKDNSVLDTFHYINNMSCAQSGK